MCEELASRISDCPVSTEKPVAEDKPETMVSPTDLSTTTNPLLTNEPMQGDGDLLRENERKFANIPDDLRIIKVCSDAGFMKTVVRGQYFCDHRRSGTGKIGLSWFMSRIHITSRWRLIQSKRMDPWKHEDRSSVGCNSQLPPRPLRNRDQNQLLVGRRISISGYDLRRIQQIRDGNVRRKTRKPRWHKWENARRNLLLKQDRSKHHWMSNQESTTNILSMLRRRFTDYLDMIFLTSEKKTEQLNSKILAPMFVSQFESSPH